MGLTLAINDSDALGHYTVELRRLNKDEVLLTIKREAAEEETIVIFDGNFKRWLMMAEGV